MRLCKSCFLNSRRNGDMWTDYVVTEVGEQVGKKIVRVKEKIFGKPGMRTGGKKG